MIPQVALLAHGAGVNQAPPVQAVLSTFTYTGAGAAEANLYDKNDSTNAADPVGLNGNTAAAFDFGVAWAPTNLRLKVSDVNGFGATTTFKIQYSDTSLSSGWTDSGSTISATGGTGGISNASISAGSHRYWRIFYFSGGSGGSNVWLGELTFS